MVWLLYLAPDIDKRWAEIEELDEMMESAPDGRPA